MPFGGSEVGSVACPDNALSGGGVMFRGGVVRRWKSDVVLGFVDVEHVWCCWPAYPTSTTTNNHIIVGSVGSGGGRSGYLRVSGLGSSDAR